LNNDPFNLLGMSSSVGLQDASPEQGMLQASWLADTSASDTLREDEAPGAHMDGRESSAPELAAPVELATAIVIDDLAEGLKCAVLRVAAPPAVTDVETGWLHGAAVFSDPVSDGARSPAQQIRAKAGGTTRITTFQMDLFVSAALVAIFMPLFMPQCW
jgi:hypothetical protein